MSPEPVHKLAGLFVLVYVGLGMAKEFGWLGGTSTDSS